MSTERPPVTNIIFGTMTLSYQGYGSRVHDTETAATMLSMYSEAGHQALDTAHDYGGGSGEQMLGDLGAAQRFTIATRYAPQGANHAHDPDKLKAAFRCSLTRLKTGLMMSLNMLIHYGDAVDFTGSDFAGWCRDAGFGDIEILPLTGLTSAGIAYT